MDNVLIQFQQFSKVSDLRQTSQRHSIYFGFCALHYAVVYGFGDIVSALAKHECLVLTKCDQIVVVDKEYYLVPAASNAAQIACIVRRQDILDLVMQKAFNQIDVKQLNKYGMSYLDIFNQTGTFSEFIADNFTFTTEIIQSSYKYWMLSSNHRVLKYIYKISTLRLEFIRQSLLYGANDFPPVEVQNEAQRYIQQMYKQIEEYAFQNLNQYENTLIEAYQSQAFNKKYQQFLQSSNAQLLKIQTDEAVLVIQQQDIIPRQVEIIESIWYNACKNGELDVVQQINQLTSIDDRDSSYFHSQFKGFTGLHYSIVSKELDIAMFLSSVEFDIPVQYNNIIITEENTFYIKKGTTTAQLAILCKFDKYIDFLSTKKIYQQLLTQDILIYWIIADYYPRNFDQMMNNLKNNFISLLYKYNSQNFITGLVSYLEIISVNQTSETLVNWIFQSNIVGSPLMLKGLEFCYKYNSNPKIYTLGQKYFKGDIKKQYENIVNQHLHSDICDIQEVLKNKFMVQEYKICQESTVEDHYFDAVLAEDNKFIIKNINDMKMKYDIRSSTNVIINGFCALFYAIYNKNMGLVQVLSTLEQNFTTPFDIILPNKFFLSKNTTVTTLAVICDVGSVLQLQKPKLQFDQRGFNFVFFSALLNQQTQLIKIGIHIVSVRKLMKWLQMTRSEVLASYITELFTEQSLMGNFVQDDGTDKVGQWLRIGYQFQTQKLRGVKQKLIEIIQTHDAEEENEGFL